MENSVSPKPKDDFCNFAAPARDSVREFNRQNHAQYMIRFHSFYAWHRKGAHDCLLDETDLTAKYLPATVRF